MLTLFIIFTILTYYINGNDNITVDIRLLYMSRVEYLTNKYIDLYINDEKVIEQVGYNTLSSYQTYINGTLFDNTIHINNIEGPLFSLTESSKYTIILFDGLTDRSISIINDESNINNLDKAPDTAYLRVINTIPNIQSNELHLYSQEEDCYQCLYQFLTSLSYPKSNDALDYHIIQTTFPTEFLISTINETFIDPRNFTSSFYNFQFNQAGLYTLLLSKNADDILEYKIFIDQHGNQYVTLEMWGYITLWLLTLYICKYIYDKLSENNNVRSNNPLNQALLPHDHQSLAKVTTKKRLISLDVFRGISLCIMIFVNLGGGNYYLFNHSKWNGLTIADTVFAWFIFMMGMGMSFVKQWKLNKIIKRSLLLYLIGLFIVNNTYNLSTWRYFGVLQRFSISYFFVALMLTYSSSIYQQYLMILFLACLWLIITFFIPYSDSCPTGYIGPGGISSYGLYPNCTGGIAYTIDQYLVHDNHLYQTPTCQALYHTGVYDPEGLLGCLTSIILVYLGVMSGKVVIQKKSKKSQAKRGSAGE